MGNENDAPRKDPGGSLNGCPSPDELLPDLELRGGEGELAGHVASCPSCSTVLAARQRVAIAVRELRRPSPAPDTLDFSVVMSAVEGRLDAELERAEARWKPLVAGLGRATMPAACANATLVALASSPRLLRRESTLRILRTAAAFAAAAGVVAAAWFARSEAPADRFAAETAQLTRGAPITVVLVDVDVPSGSEAGLRSIGRGTVPRLEPVPTARPPKIKGGP